jgi:DNA-binding MarR family transcriptional regulator
MSKQHYSVEGYKAQRSIGYLTKRANSLMMAVIEPMLEARGFTYLQFVILIWVRDGIAVNPRDICLKFHYDSGALTRVIDQLADRGLLDRVRGQRDRRTVELALTEAGRAAIEGLVPLVVGELNRALGEFTREEFEELVRLLNKLTTRLQSLVEPEAGRAAASEPSP